MSFVNKSVLEHYFYEGYNYNEIIVGVVDIINDLPKINWSVLKNFNLLNYY